MEHANEIALLYQQHIDFIGRKMVLPERFELSTSPLPRECSTPELRQLSGWLGCALGGNKPGCPSDAVVRNDAAFATTGPEGQAAFSGFFVNALNGPRNPPCSIPYPITSLMARDAWFPGIFLSNQLNGEGCRECQLRGSACGKRGRGGPSSKRKQTFGLFSEKL